MTPDIIIIITKLPTRVIQPLKKHPEIINTATKISAIARIKTAIEGHLNIVAIASILGNLTIP